MITKPKSDKSIYKALREARRDEQIALLSAVVPRPPTLTQQVEAFLTRTGMPETTFGRLAANDEKLINRLRQGCPRPGEEDKIRGFMCDAQRNLR